VHTHSSYIAQAWLQLCFYYVSTCCLAEQFVAFFLQALEYAAVGLELELGLPMQKL